jgi:hypothetical protein
LLISATTRIYNRILCSVATLLTAISKEERTAGRGKNQGKTNESRLVKYVKEDREGKKDESRLVISIEEKREGGKRGQ